MKKFLSVIISLLFVIPNYATGQKSTVKNVDICVYGGTSLGVIAAYTAKKHGRDEDDAGCDVHPDFSAHAGGLRRRAAHGDYRRRVCLRRRMAVYAGVYDDALSIGEQSTEGCVREEYGEYAKKEGKCLPSCRMLDQKQQR